MKQIMINYASVFVAATFAMSCVNGLTEPEGTDNGPVNENIEGKAFTASVEGVRSTLNGMTPEWVAGDAITVFGADGEGVSCSYVGENVFKGKVSASSPYYAVYPASSDNALDLGTGVITASVPAEQILTDGQNVAPGSLVSFALSEDENLYFRNAVGLIRIEIGRDDIASVKVSSTVAGEYLAGSFTVDPSAEEPQIEILDGVEEIVLYPAGETFMTGEYFVTALPVTVSGVKVTFTNIKSNTVEVSKSSSTEVERAGGVNLGRFLGYEIGTPAELLAWNKAAAKWTAWDVVTLTDNIDMSGIDDQWVSREFTGIFDGNGKTLSKAVLGNSATANAGLFSLMNGTVRNLIVDGFEVTGSGTTSVISGGKMYGNIEGVTVKNSTVTSGGDYGGIIVARSGGSNKHFTDCKVQACTLKVTKGSVGAICGRIENTDLEVSGCEVSNTVMSGTGSIGGIIGLCGGSAVISDCTVSGSEISGSSTNVGGIVGVSSNATTVIDGCISRDNTVTSSLNNPAYVGGLVGDMQAGCLINSTSDGNTVDARKSYAGGLAGHLTAGNIINNISSGCTVSSERSTVKDQYIGLVVGADGASATGSCKNNIVASGSLKYGSAATVGKVGIITGIRLTNKVYDTNYYNASLVENADVTGGKKILPLTGPSDTIDEEALKHGGSNPIGEGYEPALSDLHTMLNANVETLSATYPSIKKWQAVAGGWPTFVTE